MKEKHPLEKEGKYRSSMGTVTRWIFILVAIVFVGLYFKSINIFFNHSTTDAVVIKIIEWVDLEDRRRHNKSYPEIGYDKKYKVTYTYSVNGKSYEGTSIMKLAPYFGPLDSERTDRELGPIDLAPIPIVYCRHWPSFHYVKNQKVEWY